MVHGFRTIFPATVLSLLSVSPAFAQLTTQDIRNSLVNLYTRSGARVDIGAESVGKDVLSLENVSMTYQFPQNKGQASLSYAWIKMTQVGDQVVVTFAPTMQIRGHLSGKSGKDVQIKAHVGADGMTMIAAGSPEDLTLKTSVSTLELKLDNLTASGKTIPLVAGYTGQKVSSDYRIVRLANDRRRYSGKSSMDSLGIKVDFKDPAGTGYFYKADGTITDLSTVFGFEVNQMTAAELKDPLAFFKMGFDGGVTLSSGPYSLDTSFKTSRKSGNSTISATTGRAGFNLSPRAVGYDLAVTGVKVEASTPNLPVPPVKLGFDELSLAFFVPLAKSETPSDFHARTALRGLTADESLWAMVDPKQLLPRDPVTVAVDISGKLMVLADLMDPQKVQTLKGTPFLPVSVDLNELTASAAGAILTGNGHATFDLTNGKKINGVPQPIGTVTLDLKGAFGLMDSLSKMGLLKNDTATGIKAMLGAFSKPVGDDHLSSEITATPDGTITANGQRIK